MKLISMTDFVLEQSKRIMNVEITHLESHHQIVDYANFLKQPLKLEMFVPCDEDGNVLEKPKEEDYFDEGFPLEFNQKHFREVIMFEYNQSKEKVMFEGFTFKDNFILLNDKIFFAEATNAKDFFIHYETIECLSNLIIFSNEIILTPNAIKRIFG